MNKTVYKIICGAICAMFAIAILIFASSIIANKNNDIDSALQSFKKLSYKTAVAAQQYEPSNPDNSTFAVEFIKAIEDIEQYAELSLKLNEKLLYQYPPIENFSIDASAIIKQEETITTLYGNSLTLQASIYKINPSNIYYKARLPFIIILSGTILAIIMLAFIPNIKKSDDDDDENDYGYKEYDLHTEQKNTTSQQIKNDTIANIEPKNENPLDEYQKNAEEEFFVDEPTTFESNSIDTAQDNSFETVENASDEKPSEEENTQAYNETATEQMPTEEVATEEVSTEEMPAEEVEKNLENMLKAELDYAELTNQDVSVLIIKINQLDKTSLIASQIQDQMLAKFSEKGIVFNFDEDSYALILSNTTLEVAMEDAENLRVAIINILKTNDMLNEVSIGISSKNTRKIDSERLINEADKAQEHTDADSPIIAFRVDPEKYKEIYKD